MRIIKAVEWTQKDSIALAVYCAKKVLPIYEARCNNTAPRKAITIASKGLKQIQKTGRISSALARSANDAANAANAAYAAACVVNAAAAANAAYAAANAAYANTGSANAAANAANVAAITDTKLKPKIHNWIKRRKGL